MSEQKAGTQPPRIHEPSARGPAEARQDDWRGVDLDPELAAAREDARRAIGAALAAPPEPDPAWVAARAAAELAAFTCLDLAIDRLYARLDAARPSAGALVSDLAERDAFAGGLLRRALTAPDPRARYVFVEDVLAFISNPAMSRRRSA